MPGTYAHFKLGEDVRNMVSPKVALIIDEYPEVFYIGLHGPDLLFYYNALTKNKVNTIGFGMHEIAGEVFFKKAAEIIRQSGYDMACFSYILGFLCHFALDVTCHGYVNEIVEQKIADHLGFESELERVLLLENGKNPETAVLTNHLNASYKNAQVIQKFFPKLTVKEVEKCIKDMKFYLNMLIPKNNVKRGILCGALKAAGQYDSLKGLIINKNENKACQEEVKRLRKLYEDGKTLAEKLLEDYYYLSEIQNNNPTLAVKAIVEKGNELGFEIVDEELKAQIDAQIAESEVE